MPENCPIACFHYPHILDCDDCWHNEDGRCTIEKKLIKEILTTDERLDMLERRIKKQSEPMINRAYLKRLQGTESGLVDLRNALNKLDDTLQEHLSSHWNKKKGGKPKTYDSI